jgi:hypothetical protein
MAHLIFTHGRWHEYEYDELLIREKVFTHRRVGEHVEPKPGDTFSELMSPIRSALRDLRARFLDAYLYQGATWKIEKPEEQKP